LREFYTHLLHFVCDGGKDYKLLNEEIKNDIKEKTAQKIFKYCEFLDVKDNSIRYDKHKNFHNKFDDNTKKYYDDLNAFKKNLEETREKLLNELQTKLNTKQNTKENQK
jgi:hypothetical protein